MFSSKTVQKVQETKNETPKIDKPESLAKIEQEIAQKSYFEQILAFQNTREDITSEEEDAARVIKHAQQIFQESTFH